MVVKLFIPVTTIVFLLQPFRFLESALKRFQVRTSGEATLTSGDIDLGMRLSSLVREANSVLGGVVIIEYVIDLTTAVCASYYAFGLVDAFTVAPEYFEPKILAGVGYILLAAYGFWRIWIFQSMGQRFSNTYQVCAYIFFLS